MSTPWTEAASELKQPQNQPTQPTQPTSTQSTQTGDVWAQAATELTPQTSASQTEHDPNARFALQGPATISATP